MKRILTFSLLFNFLITCGLNSQDFDFSQWYNNPTYYNPAYVGLTSGLKARFTYRRQMVKIPASFKTYAFSADIAERNLPGAGGIGILVDNYNASQGLVNHPPGSGTQSRQSRRRGSVLPRTSRAAPLPSRPPKEPVPCCGRD